MSDLEVWLRRKWKSHSETLSHSFFLHSVVLQSTSYSSAQMNKRHWVISTAATAQICEQGRLPFGSCQQPYKETSPFAGSFQILVPISISLKGPIFTVEMIRVAYLVQMTPVYSVKWFNPLRPKVFENNLRVFRGQRSLKSLFLSLWSG